MNSTIIFNWTFFTAPFSIICSFTKDPAFQRRFREVEVKEPKLKDVKNMIKLKVNNLEKYHGVVISEEILNYCIITAKAMNCTACNPDLTIDLVDMAMAYAKMENSKKLEKVYVDKVYTANYDVYKSMKEKDRRLIAYHEAGHALLQLLAKYNIIKEVKIVSIIPTSNYKGINIIEENDKILQIPITKETIIEEASMLLAGRVAQEYVDNNWDFGASSDLREATKIIRKMIVEMGMDDNLYKNINLYNEDLNTYNMSPAAIDRVNERVQEIMVTVYEKTKKILEENKAKLDVIANLLMERGIISIEEIEENFRKIK